MIIKMKRLYAMILAITISFTALSAVSVGVSANTAGYNSWFSSLPTLTDQTVANIQADTTVNDAKYAAFYDYTNQPYRRISTSPSSVKVSSAQTWDETGGTDRRGYAVLKLDQVDDIYGTNQGMYVYDVDFNLALTGVDNLAPISTAGSKKAHCVYLGFFGGATDNGTSPSYSVINLYRDKAVETMERTTGEQNADLATFDGDGLTDGKYNIKYEYVTGTSASAARVNIVLTKYQSDGVTLESVPVMSISNKKLKKMIAESAVQYSSATNASLGWIEVGVRTPYTGSSIEVTKASFEKSQFSDWFAKLPTLTNQRISEIQASNANLSDYVKFRDPSTYFARFDTAPNSVKVSSALGSADNNAGRRGYAVLKLDKIDDIYGTNQGTYVYDVDFNLTLTGEGDMAPTSTAGSRQAHCVYLGFFGGAADDGDNPSYSVINLFRDKATQSLERIESSDKSDLATFNGEGLTDGKYNIKYEYVTGANASAARVNILLTKYQADGVTLENTPVMTVSNQKLDKMIAESKETYSQETNASLGYMEIGVRNAYTGSSVEVTKANFGNSLSEITLTDEMAELNVGDTKKLTANITPFDAINTTVIWASSATDIATVDQNGMITAVSSGTAIITASNEWGTKKAACIVTVKPIPFGEWFSNLPELTEQTIVNIQNNVTVNDSNNTKFYDYPNQSHRRFSTAQNSIKVSSDQSWDETGGSDRRGYAVLKLDQVDDIYGTNQGTYIYDVDFNLTLTGADTLAPVSTAGNRKAHCVYLGFYGGTETDDAAASYSVINLYRDKIIESWERDNNDKGELASFEGDGLADGKYNIKYEYITGASASDARVNIMLTKYKADGVTLESTPVMSITDKKLKHMLAESTETYSAATKASLGWIEVGVRTPYTGSSIEITKASFGFKQNLNRDLFISKAELYADEKLPQNRVFALENGRTYSKLFVDLFVEKLNTTPSNKKIDVILALYKKENDTKRLVFIDMKQCDFEKQNNYVCSFEIDSFMAKEGTIIKLFAWSENGCPESDPQEFVVGTVTDLTTRDLELIKSRLVSNIYSNSIDVSSTTALLTDGRFSDLSYDASENCVNALTRASNMLKAYFSVGNNMYMNETLKAQIADVLEDWAQNDYQSSNWWWNDIGVPNILSNSFVYPLEDIISSSTLSTLLTIARRGIPSIDENKVHKNEDAAGANLIDKLVIALRIAALTGDTEGMEIVSRLLDNELQVFTQASAECMDEYVSGNTSTVDISAYEGIAPDYSFKQHGILYTGGYGKSFTDGIATLLAWLQDTQYMPSSRAVNLYADFILDGYAPMFKGEGSDFSIMGRNISRETEENAVKFTSLKAIETLTKYSQISRRIELMNLYDDRIIDNDNGTTFAKHYWASDYTVFHRPDYFVGVKNFSNRNISTEFINGENRYGFYLSDGATAILKTGMEYRGIYPVWDWSRIPGTTTTYLEGSSVQIGANNNVANNMFQNGTKNFVGGVSDGIYAVSAMDYEHKHGSNYKTSAKKAVFMFDDGFVSLGANIKGTDWFNSVNTTLNQCNLNGDVTYSEDNLSTKKLASETEEKISAKWINHDGVSYILPSAQNITVSNKAKTGSWRKINNSGSEDEITKNVFTAYINHGTRPSSASYEYTVLPSATIDETKSYSDSPDMLTVTNTNDTQSVWSKKANALGAVFYSGNQTISIGTEITGFENTLSIKSSNPCIVLLKKTVTGWKLSVSDPTNGSISNTVITVNGVAHDVTLPTGNNCGKTITLDI